MHRLNAGFDTINGTAVGNAHQSEYLSLCDRLGNGHGLTSDEISAQALHDLIIRGANTPATHDNNRPTVNIHVITDGQTLSTGPHDQSIIETVAGMPLCPEILGRLTCDCIIERIDSLPDGTDQTGHTTKPLHHQTIAPPVPVLHRTQEDEETTSVLAA